MSELYTNSRLKVFRECMRKHYFRYTLGLQQSMGDAAIFGTVGHKAIEAWLLAWKRGDLDARLPEALAAIDDCDLSPFDQARLRSLITAYHLRWKDEPWEVIAVESEFRYELGGHVIGGKVDAIIRDTRDGRVWLVEHKTTGQDAAPGGSYWEKLALDSQVSIYVDGATVLGHEIAGVIYDVLQRPRHEQKLATPMHEREYTAGKGCKKCGGSAKAGEIEKGHGFYTVAFANETKQIECDGCSGTGWKLDKDGKPEAPRLYAKHRDADETLDQFSERVLEEIANAPDSYLIRGTVVRLEDELPRMRQDILDAIRLERAAALFDLHPRNPDACARFGAMCSYFPICSGRASENDESLFPRGAAHPELANAA